MEKKKKDLLVFGYGLGFIAAVFAVGGIIKHGVQGASIILLCWSIIFAVGTTFNWPALKPAYYIWMKVAHIISTIVTSIILTAVFFLVFTPVGLFFRLIGKDYLRRRFDPNALTYWEQRSRVSFDKKRYQQQY